MLEKGNHAIVEVQLRENEHQTILNNKHIIHLVKNRFMVEYATVSDEIVSSIANCPPGEKADTFRNVWSKNGIIIFKSKLNVVFDVNDEQAGSIYPKESKVARMKPKVVKATRKLPSSDIPSYDTINYQFGDICRGETVQLKDPNRFGVVLKVVKGRRGATYTVEIGDGSVLENLSRNSLWKVLK